ncbi:MAG: putative 2-aminoethylphosphonate ABC transporter ATP-binding protein [Deltaproteobacteria bacterium]|nr:putative 2-aminoethylphosphonate ABC transporter ATP-binding protein [Deltaproteobacteria bacterium]
MDTSPDTAAYLDVRNVTKTFGRFRALDDVSFSVSAGEFVTILGPSGCGKTTILRVIAGLEKQDAGSIHIRGHDVGILPVSRRNIGIVFQNYALFPNLTAAANVAYGLTGSMSERRLVQGRVEELLDLVGLTGMGEKYPAQLSGGQQQRVALARAMALSPSLLLLDEPLSALDAKVRILLRSEIRRLQKRLNITTIMVTHDQEEALTMADRILVMNQGRAAQYGTPLDIYDRPVSPFVASFIGSMNFIPGARAIDTGSVSLGGLTLFLDNGDNGRDIERNARMAVAIRPEDVLIAPGARAGKNRVPNEVRAKVRFMEYRGAVYRVQMDLWLEHGSEAPIEAEIPTEKIRRLSVREDSLLDLVLPPDRLRVYPMDQTGIHA